MKTTTIMMIAFMVFSFGFAGNESGVPNSDDHLCRRLSEIQRLPFKEGEPVADPIYNEIMREGKKAIPCLIKKIADVRSMSDPRPAPPVENFRVSDLAFFLLLDITKARMEDFLPDDVVSRMPEEGIYAYFEFVEKKDNRKYMMAPKKVVTAV